MLSLSQIASLYPPTLQPFGRSMLREYLQYKILNLIFESTYGAKLSFLGGTALRIVYDNTRFSEDLDFDNFGLEYSEFTALAEKIQYGLQLEGMIVQIDTVSKGAYRCRIRLPEILYQNELSALTEEKILIQIDSMAHHFPYVPDQKIINKFDVFSRISVTPIDILLSQKLFAAISRKRAKGRDFFDIIFLLSRTLPNYAYLREKIGVTTAEELKEKLSQDIAALDFHELARDVEPFLFTPSDSKKVEMFPEYISGANLG
ncbi:MAG: nucleotidyl transferase AbiEii/AbiGii toxin family protein [Candidatus Woesebacteria bacterium]